MINTDTVLKSYGFGIEMSYLLPNNFTISGNISSDALYDVPDNLVTNFNAPKYRTNISIANSGIDSKKRWSFATSWHWQESFLYESQFVNGILPAYHNIDAQISYKINKSKIKLGATNLLNYYYRNGLGNSNIGGTYYISYIIDVL